MKKEEDLVCIPMCTVLHGLMCSRCYLNGDSQTSLFTSDLLPTTQSHISDCHSNMLLQFSNTQKQQTNKQIHSFFLHRRSRCFSNYISCCFASLLAASGRSVPTQVFYHAISLQGVLHPLSHTLSFFSFYCLDSSLKHFSSPCATLALFKGTPTLSACLFDFYCKCIQATLSARVHLQI